MWSYSVAEPRILTRSTSAAPTADDMGPSEVLLRVLAGGICGSDLPVFNGRIASLGTGAISHPAAAPGVPAHEVVGEVVATRHSSHHPGDLVAGWATRWNGLAEFTITDGEGLTPVDATLPLQQAVMVQPLACVLYAADRLGEVRGATVAILGLGPIGLLFAHVLSSRGPAALVGVDRVDRSALASAFGLTETIKASSDRWATDLEPSQRPEIIVEAIGHQGSTLHDAVHAVGDSGLIYYFGIVEDRAYAFDLATFVRKNVTLMSGVARDRGHYLREADAYMRSHPQLPSEYVTTTLPVTQIQQAFEIADSPNPERIKVTFSI